MQVNSYKNPLVALRKCLTNVIEKGQESDAEISQLCTQVIEAFGNQIIDRVDHYRLLRSMCQFMHANTSNHKVSKTALRDCLASICQAPPNMEKDFDCYSAKKVMKSYPCQYDVLEFLNLFNEKETLPIEILTLLSQLDKLDESVRSKLYGALSKSGNKCKDYFLLIGYSMELRIDHDWYNCDFENAEDYGSEDDTYHPNWNCIIPMESILAILIQEPDGGYMLLRKAAILCPNRVDLLLLSINEVKNYPDENENDLNNSITLFREICPSDREDVLLSILDLLDKWDLPYFIDEFDAESVLRGVATIPQEHRDAVLALLPYDSYEVFSSDLDFNGIIATLLLQPFIVSQQQISIEESPEVLVSLLEEKLLDHSLPPFTLYQLAGFALDMGVPANSQIEALATIIYEAGLTEPERTKAIEEGLERLWDAI